MVSVLVLSCAWAYKPSASLTVSRVSSFVQKRPLACLAASFVVGLTCGLASQHALVDLFAHYKTVDDVPSRLFQRHARLKARVVKVTDGDTLRARHLGGFYKPSKKLSDSTLQIRLYAVDAPETAKFGKPGQKLGPEATEFVKRKLEDKTVRVTLLARDQYGRAIARVTYKRFFIFERDISAELLSSGLARIYRQGGAQYDGRLASFEAKERDAKAHNRGIWALSSADNDPAAYKKKYAH